MKLLFTTLLLASSTSAFAGKAPFDLFLFGEKPGLASPFELAAGSALRVHLARDGFATLLLQLPAEEGRALVKLDNVELGGAKFGGAPTTVQAYALGAQAIEKSSFRNGPPTVAEVADMAVPNEWLSRPGFHIPEKRVPKRPMYLFELHAPADAAPGDFQATLRFHRGAKEFEVPLQLRVHKLKLPKRFKLKTSFGFAPYGSLMKHFGKWVDKEMEVHDVYTRLAAEHRIDLHKFYVKAPNPGAQAGGKDPLTAGDKVSFLRLWQRASSPTATPYGFSASFTDLPIPDAEKTAPTEAFWKAYEASVIANDLLDRSFVYFSDEPEAKTFPQVRAALGKIRGWAPQLQFMGVTDLNPKLVGGFNIWCPNLIFWEKAGHPAPAEYYERREKNGEHLWIYTSCSAHGCGPAYEENVADLVIDRPAAYQRAFAWSAYYARAEGILYYNTVEGYGTSDLTPWHEPFLFHGNGEGNLFYPCNPRLCGVDGVNVVPSLRLKNIRDGLEDVEIFEAGERAGLPVRDWVKTAFRSVRDFSRSAAEFEKVRVRVLEALDGNRQAPAAP